MVLSAEEIQTELGRLADDLKFAVRNRRSIPPPSIP